MQRSGMGQANEFTSRTQPNQNRPSRDSTSREAVPPAPAAGERNGLLVAADHPDFFAFLEQLPVAAYLCDSEGRITYFNAEAVRLWGRAPDLHEPVERFCGALKIYTTAGTPISHEQCWVARALAEDRDFPGQELVIERPDGVRTTVQAYIHPYHDAQGTIRGVVNVFIERPQQQAVVEAVYREADARKADFLALLAHELRNPLAPLRNGLQIIRLAADDRAAVEEARAMMERQIGQMVKLIDELSDLSRIANGKIDLHRENLDLNAVLREAMAASRPLFESSGHRLHLSLATQPVLVQGDRARLIQVFTNLLNNSAQFTPRGGQIWLMVETDGSEVYVVLKDNGIGIEPERLPRIFDLFSLMHSSREAAPSGLGIGLSLVRALVELHGGRVEARSAGRGQGAEFIVHLPLAAKGNTTLGTEEEMAEPASYRILVVDDNVDSATSLTMMLRMMGHEIKTAHDGKAALAAAHSFRPDIILLDIGLPELSGYEVCQRIRQEPWGQNMVIIAQTGWGQEEDRRKSKEMGFNYHLVKPVDPALLTALIGGILHASEA